MSEWNTNNRPGNWCSTLTISTLSRPRVPMAAPRGQLMSEWRRPGRSAWAAASALTAGRMRWVACGLQNIPTSAHLGGASRGTVAGVWLYEYPGLSFQRSPVCACSLVSSLLLSGATMSQQSSLTQSAHSVRQVLTAYRMDHIRRRIGGVLNSAAECSGVRFVMDRRQFGCAAVPCGKERVEALWRSWLEGWPPFNSSCRPGANSGCRLTET